MGVQLGLCIMALMALLLLTPPTRLRRPIIMTYTISLVVAILRIIFQIRYFPGPLTEFYVLWTRDRGGLDDSCFDLIIAGDVFSVIQFTLIEMALIMQTYGIMKAWPQWWKVFVRFSAVVLAVATIATKSLWALHHTWAVKTMVLPIKLDTIGEAATTLGAVSIFYFCGIFAVDLSVHLINIRCILQKFDRSLSSLEILAIGNGILMVLPSEYNPF